MDTSANGARWNVNRGEGFSGALERVNELEGTKNSWILLTLLLLVITSTWKGYLILPRSSNFHISSRFHFYEWEDCVRQIYNIDYRIYVLRRNFVRSSKISNHPRNVSTAIVGNDQWRPLYLFTITHNLRVVNQIEVNCWTSHTTDLSASVILNTCTESDWSLDERLRVVITQYEL